MAQVLFLIFFSEKDPHLNAVDYQHMSFSLPYRKFLSYEHRPVLPTFNISKLDCKSMKICVRLYCFLIKQKL